MSQTINHSTPHLATEGSWKDKYYVNFYTQRKNVISPRIIEELAKDLVTWAAKDKKALKASQFYLEKGISTSTFYYFMDKYQILKEAYQSAKELIGNRREIGAMHNKLNASVVIPQMAQYDRDWWKLEQDRAHLRAMSQQKNDQDIKYVVVVDSYEKEDKTETKNLPEEK